MPTALITGASKRIGKTIATTLHPEYDVIVHCNSSITDAQKLVDSLNQIRAESATIISADLSKEKEIDNLCRQINQIDLLINNASVFYPTTIEQVTSDEFNKFMHTNVLAPLLLSKNLHPKLKKSRGNIINIVDIHALRPLKDYAVYNISKAGIYMLTQTLAKELAPEIRVNGVSPGSILWPENAAKISEGEKNNILDKIPIKAQGNPQDIADTVLFLAKNKYINGQIINVDGGRTLNQ